MMATLFKACLAYSMAIILLFGFWSMPGVPRTVSFLQPMVFFGLIVASRTISGFFILELLGRRMNLHEATLALIYGAGEHGQQLAASARREHSVRIVGYIDDDEHLAGSKLDGIKIHSGADLEAAIRKSGATMILIAIPGLSQTKRREIVDRLSDFKIQVQILPGLGQLIDGTISISDTRPIELADLLGRQTVSPNPLLLSRTIIGKTVMVTGAGGSIGSELCRQILEQRPVRLILVEMSEHSLYLIEQELVRLRKAIGHQTEIVAELANIADQPSVERLFRRYKTNTVFHAAAYKHVPLVEANLIGGMRNNIMGTRNCATEAVKTKVDRFILVSTDKAVRPTNVMGASKRVCELILQAFSKESPPTCFAMVRFGNVLGSSGSVVPEFERQIRAGGPITITDRKITRYFMTIPEAAQLVIQAGAMAEGGEVFVLDMGEPVKIFDLATSMINLSGLTIKDDSNPDGDIEIVEVGLRPGEKLYEELLIGSNATSTRHEMIMQAREAWLAQAVLAARLDELAKVLDLGDKEQSLDLLCELVPEYQPFDGTHIRQAI